MAMKKGLILAVFLGLVLSFSSCVENETPGPQGPAGPQGPQGEPGESGYVFEYTNVNFTAPNYEAFLDFGDFEVLQSDVVLVYLLWEVQEINGQLVDIWRPLPQTIFHPDGILQYNFDYGVTDVRLFLDADFPLDLLNAIDTDQWIVRVVVAPGEFVDPSSRIDLSNFYDVAKQLGLPTGNINRELAIKRRVVR
jgi:hypothetical protein